MIRVAVIFLLLFCSAGYSEDTLNIISGIHKPPYVNQNEDSGFEIELVRNIIKLMGKSTKFSYVNYGRGSKMLYMEGVDGVMTTNRLVFEDPTVLTKPYIHYQNVAISLAENKFEIDKISHLANYSIASFQLADKVLGSEFSDAATASPMYIQMGHQDKQPEMLFRKRVDILIMEKQIFFALLAKSNWAKYADKTKVHYVFPTNHYSMAFSDKANVSLFNQAMQQYLASEEYQALRAKYLIEQKELVL